MVAEENTTPHLREAAASSPQPSSPGATARRIMNMLSGRGSSFEENNLMSPPTEGAEKLSHAMQLTPVPSSSSSRLPDRKRSKLLQRSKKGSVSCYDLQSMLEKDQQSNLNNRQSLTRSRSQRHRIMSMSATITSKGSSVTSSSSDQSREVHKKKKSSSSKSDNDIYEAASHKLQQRRNKLLMSRQMKGRMSVSCSNLIQQQQPPATQWRRNSVGSMDKDGEDENDQQPHHLNNSNDPQTTNNKAASPTKRNNAAASSLSADEMHNDEERQQQQRRKKMSSKQRSASYRNLSSTGKRKSSRKLMQDELSGSNHKNSTSNKKKDRSGSLFFSSGSDHSGLNDNTSDSNHNKAEQQSERNKTSASAATNTKESSNSNDQHRRRKKLVKRAASCYNFSTASADASSSSLMSMAETTNPLKSTSPSRRRRGSESGSGRSASPSRRSSGGGSSSKKVTRRKHKKSRRSSSQSSGDGDETSASNNTTDGDWDSSDPELKLKSSSRHSKKGSKRGSSRKTRGGDNGKLETVPEPRSMGTRAQSCPRLMIMDDILKEEEEKAKQVTAAASPQKASSSKKESSKPPQSLGDAKPSAESSRGSASRAPGVEGPKRTKSENPSKQPASKPSRRGIMRADSSRKVRSAALRMQRAESCPRLRLGEEPDSPTFPKQRQPTAPHATAMSPPSPASRGESAKLRAVQPADEAAQQEEATAKETLMRRADSCPRLQIDDPSTNSGPLSPGLEKIPEKKRSTKRDPSRARGQKDQPQQSTTDTEPQPRSLKKHLSQRVNKKSSKKSSDGDTAAQSSRSSAEERKKSKSGDEKSNGRSVSRKKATRKSDDEKSGSRSTSRKRSSQQVASVDGTDQEASLQTPLATIEEKKSDHTMPEDLTASMNGTSAATAGMKSSTSPKPPVRKAEGEREPKTPQTEETKALSNSLSRLPEVPDVSSLSDSSNHSHSFSTLTNSFTSSMADEQPLYQNSPVPPNRTFQQRKPSFDGPPQLHSSFEGGHVPNRGDGLAAQSSFEGPAAPGQGSATGWQGTWQSESDFNDRRTVIESVIQAIKETLPVLNTTASPTKQSYMARKLEEQLYRSAATKEEYMDQSTVIQRLNLALSNFEAPGTGGSVEEDPDQDNQRQQVDSEKDPNDQDEQRESEVDPGEQRQQHESPKEPSGPLLNAASHSSETKEQKTAVPEILKEESGWQSDEDLPHRRDMILKVSEVIRQMRPGVENAKLSQMSKGLENLLYQSARTKEEYLDLATLKQRMSLVLAPPPQTKNGTVEQKSSEVNCPGPEPTPAAKANRSDSSPAAPAEENLSAAAQASSNGDSHQLQPEEKWQSNADLPDRRTMIVSITEVIKVTLPNSDPSKLPHMAKGLEERLYLSAATKEEYLDESTLKKRMNSVLGSANSTASAEAGGGTKTPENAQKGVDGTKPPNVEQPSSGAKEAPSSTTDKTTAGGWQSNENDLSDRREMIKTIAELIRVLQPSTDPAKLPHMAKAVEELLYRSSPTKQEYLDKNTLKQRMNTVLGKPAEPPRETDTKVESSSQEGTWRSDENDLPDRRKMILAVVEVIKSLQPNMATNPKLPQMAKGIEDILYRSAPSKEAYLDQGTLKQRMNSAIGKPTSADEPVKQPTNSTPPSESKPPAAWQSGEDLPDRRNIILSIVEFIKIMKPNADPKRLPHMAKSLEELLYRRASSKEEYLDSSTLKQRIVAVTERLNQRLDEKQTAQAVQSHSSSVDANRSEISAETQAASKPREAPEDRFRPRRTRSVLLERAKSWSQLSQTSRNEEPTGPPSPRSRSSSSKRPKQNVPAVRSKSSRALLSQPPSTSDKIVNDKAEDATPPCDTGYRRSKSSRELMSDEPKRALKYGRSKSSHDLMYRRGRLENV